MFPEAKLKMVNTLKTAANIVGMTGDGVNDGPALKAANIGIAMGKKGTETARQASDLVLSDDNLDNIVTAIAEGRRIFSNLVKAIRYIISIHIPIMFTAAMPLLLGWRYPNIFTPIHIIFMELIMAPTCSIFYEKEHVEKIILKSAPRSTSSGLFTRRELFITIVQGLTIATAVLTMYHIFMSGGYSIGETRMVVFTTLLSANLFLTFANRSFSKSILHTLRYKNNLVPFVVAATFSFLALLHLVTPLRNLFELESIPFNVFLQCFGIGFCSVMWIEIYKSFIKPGGLPDKPR
jgi:Ca2+-transporting ATPase